MEERKLNFDTPLLSMRQPMMNRRRELIYPDMEQQVTEPVAVPFMWEHIPGRAKEEEVFSSISPRPNQITKFQNKPINVSAQVKKHGNLEINDDDDDDDDDDEFSDAVETLSQAESISCSFNCSSMSSRSSGFVHNPSGTFLVDHKTRDLMMNRFLPAARAVAIGLSQNYTPNSGKLAIVPFEPPKSDLVREKTSKVPSKQYSSNIMHHYYQEVVAKEETEDDDDGADNTTEYDIQSFKTNKGCGLLPRLCLKSSLCLLNPIPGMKARAPSPTSFTSKAKKFIREASVRSVSQPKSRGFVDNGKKLDRETISPKMPKKLFGGSSRFNFSGEVKTRGSLSPFRQPKNTNEALSGEVHNGGRFSPRSNVSFREQRASRRVNYSGELLVKPRNSDVCNHQYAASSSRVNNLSGELQSRRHLSPLTQSRMNNTDRALLEKTLHIDSIRALQNSHSSSTLSDQVDDQVKETCSSSQDIQCMDDLNCGAIVVYEDPAPHIPLPSLKSPSESWLWKALPTVPSRRSFHSFKKQTSSNDTKWENIVKSSNLHHDHVRYSEELASRVPQQLN